MTSSNYNYKLANYYFTDQEGGDLQCGKQTAHTNYRDNYLNILPNFFFVP